MELFKDICLGVGCAILVGGVIKYWNLHCRNVDEKLDVIIDLLKKKGLK